MSNYLGDITEDATIRGSFNTRDTSGAPITLAGTPALAVYKDAGTTESTAGVTLTVDFDSRTGHHIFTIDTSADAFYATGSDYRIVLAAGTVGGTSVVGVEVGSFSIQNRFIRAQPLDAAGTRSALGMGSANLDTQLADLPTVAEFELRTLPSADYFVVGDYTVPPTTTQISSKIAEDVENQENNWDAATSVLKANLPTVAQFEARTLVAASYLTATAYNQAEAETYNALIERFDATDEVVTEAGSAILAELTAMKGETFNTSTDSLEAIRNRGDAAWVTGSGGGGSGEGQYRVTIAVEDADEDSVANVRLKIVGTTLTAITGTDGSRYFDLDDGTYMLRVTPPHIYEDVDDIEFAVDGDDLTLDTISLVSTTIAPPSDPTLSSGTLRLLNQHGSPIVGAKVRFEVVGQPRFASQSVIVNKTIQYTTNSSGIVSPTLIRASAFTGTAQYDVVIGSSFDAGGERRLRIAAPTGSTFSIELGV